MNVIVCGGRTLSGAEDAAKIKAVLSNWLNPDDVVFHGDARGADRICASIAKRMGCKIRTFPADWESHGKSAGPIRNEKMLDAGAELVIAFPGGKGTMGMVSAAAKRGVPVMVVTEKKDGNKTTTKLMAAHYNEIERKVELIDLAEHIKLPVENPCSQHPPSSSTEPS